MTYLTTRTKILLGILLTVVLVTTYLKYEVERPHCVTITPDGEVVKRCDVEGETIRIVEE